MHNQYFTKLLSNSLSLSLPPLLLSFFLSLYCFFFSYNSHGLKNFYSLQNFYDNGNKTNHTESTDVLHISMNSKETWIINIPD